MKKSQLEQIIKETINELEDIEALGSPELVRLRRRYCGGIGQLAPSQLKILHITMINNASLPPVGTRVKVVHPVPSGYPNVAFQTLGGTPTGPLTSVTQSSIEWLQYQGPLAPSWSRIFFYFECSQDRPLPRDITHRTL